MLTIEIIAVVAAVYVTLVALALATRLPVIRGALERRAAR